VTLVRLTLCGSVRNTANHEKIGSHQLASARAMLAQLGSDNIAATIGKKSGPRYLTVGPKAIYAAAWEGGDARFSALLAVLHCLHWHAMCEQESFSPLIHLSHVLAHSPEPGLYAVWPLL
jgi:hypothetical protein